ncbi:hypothetical protein MPLB_1750002 [Mesorhizobium sp. ORS 3324]|nr:hypothetical protein MPLB_1750002 [Mesorhizobium sp. ORS 3324]
MTGPPHNALVIPPSVGSVCPITKFAASQALFEATLIEGLARMRESAAVGRKANGGSDAQMGRDTRHHRLSRRFRRPGHLHA